MLEHGQGVEREAGLLDAVGTAIIVTDAAGTITHWSAGAQSLYGFEPDEVLGRPIADITVPPSASGEAEAIMQQVRRGRSWSGEFAVRAKHGGVVVAEVVLSPLIGPDGEIAGMIGVSADTYRNGAPAPAPTAPPPPPGLLAALAAGAPIGFAAFDRALRYRLINQALAASHNLT